MDRFGEMRVIDTPLAESSIVGVAIGAAVNGMLPVAEIQFLDFIHPAMDQIMNEAAKIRYRSNGDFGCPIVIRTPYGGGIHGALYHSQSIEALFTHTPGPEGRRADRPVRRKGVAASRHPRSRPGHLPGAQERLPRGTRRGAGRAATPCRSARPAVVREGSDMTIISYGWYLQEALPAADAYMAEQDATIEVIDLRSLAPARHATTILESVMKTGKVMIVHEANKFGGLGGEISAIIAEEAFAYLDGPIVRLAWPEVPAMPYSPPLEKAFMQRQHDIRAAIEKLAAY